MFQRFICKPTLANNVAPLQGRLLVVADRGGEDAAPGPLQRAVCSSHACEMNDVRRIGLRGSAHNEIVPERLLSQVQQRIPAGGSSVATGLVHCRPMPVRGSLLAQACQPCWAGRHLWPRQEASVRLRIQTPGCRGDMPGGVAAGSIRA